MTWNDTQGETLSHKCDVRHCASIDGARRAQNCALYTSVCFVVSVPLFAMWFRLFMSVCRSQMFVNMRCMIHSLYRTPGRENTNPETSHDKVEFATLRSQMSEVRCLSSCRNQIPTVSFLSSFYATPSYQTVVDTMKKKPLTRRCHHALLETKTGARISMTRTTCNRLNISQRIQITLPTLLTQGWSLPRCGFGCQRWDVGLHVEVRFPLYLSYRHSPQHQLMRCQHDEKESVQSFVSVPIRLAREKKKKNRKHLWDLDIYSGIPF